MAMAMELEKAELSLNVSLERMAPVSAAPAVQGKSSPGEKQGKPRRRRPPEEVLAEPEEEENKRPPHRVDSLA